MNWFSTNFNLNQHLPALPFCSSLFDFCAALAIKNHPLSTICIVIECSSKVKLAQRVKLVPPSLGLVCPHKLLLTAFNSLEFAATFK